MKKWFNRLWLWLKDNAENDPTRNCSVHRTIGCSHIDGYLCDMRDCSILTRYKKEIEKNKEYLNV